LFADAGSVASQLGAAAAGRASAPWLGPLHYIASLCGSRHRTYRHSSPSCLAAACILQQHARIGAARQPASCRHLWSPRVATPCVLVVLAVSALTACWFCWLSHPHYSPPQGHAMSIPQATRAHWPQACNTHAVTGSGSRVLASPAATLPAQLLTQPQAAARGQRLQPFQRSQRLLPQRLPPQRSQGLLRFQGSFLGQPGGGRLGQPGGGRPGGGRVQEGGPPPPPHHILQGARTAASNLSCTLSSASTCDARQTHRPPSQQLPKQQGARTAPLPQPSPCLRAHQLSGPLLPPAATWGSCSRAGISIPSPKMLMSTDTPPGSVLAASTAAAGEGAAAQRKATVSEGLPRLWLSMQAPRLWTCVGTPAVAQARARCQPWAWGAALPAAVSGLP
jgi:hypothetical protein